MGQDDLALLAAPSGDALALLSRCFRAALPSSDDATRKLRSGSRE
jgi:hypothetical protein